MELVDMRVLEARAQASRFESRRGDKKGYRIMVSLAVSKTVDGSSNLSVPVRSYAGIGIQGGLKIR